MRRFSMRRTWALLAVVTAAAAFSLFVPLAACSSCSGAGNITVMQSHPEAMGSGASASGRLAEAPCPECDGASRVSLYHHLTWEPAALSRK